MRLTAVYSLASLVAANTAWAQGDLTRQEPIVVRVNLGNADDARVFEPAGMTFETGKLYRLVLHNPSKTKHYFTSPGLADRVFTRKVEVMGPDGVTAVSEIKGAIREIEVFLLGARLNGGSCRWRRSVAPNCIATSRTRTAKLIPRKAWSAASRSSDGD